MTGGKAQVIYFNDPEFVVLKYTGQGVLNEIAKWPGCKVVDKVQFTGTELGSTLQQKAATALLGVGQVKKAAVHPLSKQIKGAGSASLQQIAILTAGGDRAIAAPGGSSRTYVLTQAPNALKLASFTGPGAQSGDHTGREIVLGAGAGLLVLAMGVFGGLLIGRRRVA